MSRFFTGFSIGVRNQPRLAHEAGFALHPETGFGFNGLHGFSIVETSHGIAAQLVSRRAVDRYSAASPPHRNQRKTSHRNQQPTHNETSNTPHRDSPIPRSETSDTDLKHSRSTTFETSDKPHPKPATNPTPKPAHNPRQRPKRNQRNYNVHSAKAKAKSKADQTHPWRGALPGRSAPSTPYPARLYGAARAPTTSRQETAKNPAAPCPARGGSGGSIFEGQPFVGSIGQTLALVLARGSLDLLKPARPSP